jgi:hypothetical protein
MPNLRLAPGIAAARAKQAGRRGIRPRRRGGGWIEAVKVVFLLERPRRRKGSSPSLRQIALVVVSAGIVLVIVRAATHRGKSRAGEAAVSTPPDSDSDTDPDTHSDTDPDTHSDTDSDSVSESDTGSDTVPGNESPLAERVQDEMFHRSDAVRPDA